jgi:hypothetical protein
MILNALWAIFPVTLAFLVVVLVGKEVFDRLVGRAHNRRRVAAIKAIVGEELGRNVVTASALGQALHRIEDGIDHDCEVHLSSQSDALEVRTSSKAGGQGTLTLVRPVRKDAVDQFVMDAAGLDRELFQLMLKWGRAAADLEEVRGDLMVRAGRSLEAQGAEQLKSFASGHVHPVADLRSTFHSGWVYCAPAHAVAAVREHRPSPHG